MSETESGKQIIDENKARAMADAEAPHRDKKLELISERKKEFAERLDEIKSIAADDGRELTDIKPNADEELYAQSARTKAPNHGYAHGGNLADLPTDPNNVAKIAKALIEQGNVRSQRVLTKDHNDLQHPFDAEVDKIIANYEGKDFDGDPGFVRAGALERVHKELPEALGKELIDPSRSVASDKASEDAGKAYDERQRIKQVVDDAREAIKEL